MAGSEKTAGAPAEVKPATVAELSAAFPQLVAQISAAAATAERERIIGIEQAAGKRKGIDALVAGMKADPAVTADKAAMRILQHENAQLEAAYANIRGVEGESGKMKAAANSGNEQQQQQQQATSPDGWKAEYEKSESLRAEFASAAVYVAFKQGEADGRIRRLTTKTA